MKLSDLSQVNELKTKIDNLTKLLTWLATPLPDAQVARFCVGSQIVLASENGSDDKTLCETIMGTIRTHIEGQISDLKTQLEGLGVEIDET